MDVLGSSGAVDPALRAPCQYSSAIWMDVPPIHFHAVMNSGVFVHLDRRRSTTGAREGRVNNYHDVEERGMRRRMEYETHWRGARAWRASTLTVGV